MRLWHYKLIPKLPRQQLLGQHRECCALRGNGWGRKHATVDYVFGYSPGKLVSFHLEVMAEMARRGYSADPRWSNPQYRGTHCDPWKAPILLSDSSYAEHDDNYLTECLDNLSRKGVHIPFTLTSQSHIIRVINQLREVTPMEKVTLQTSYKELQKQASALGLKMVIGVKKQELVDFINTHIVEPPTDPSTITVQELAAELGYSPKILRRKLRKANISKPAGRWAWEATDPELVEIRNSCKRTA